MGLWSNSVLGNVLVCVWGPGSAFLGKSSSYDAGLVIYGIVCVHACACVSGWWPRSILCVPLACVSGSLSGMPAPLGCVWVFIVILEGSWVHGCFRDLAVTILVSDPSMLRASSEPGPTLRLLPPPSPIDASHFLWTCSARWMPISERQELRLRVLCPFPCSGSTAIASVELA